MPDCLCGGGKKWLPTPCKKIQILQLDSICNVAQLITKVLCYHGDLCVNVISSINWPSQNFNIRNVLDLYFAVFKGAGGTKLLDDNT